MGRTIVEHQLVSMLTQARIDKYCSDGVGDADADPGANVLLQSSMHRGSAMIGPTASGNPSRTTRACAHDVIACGAALSLKSRMGRLAWA